MSPWLAIVGLGEDGLDGLAPGARTLVADAEVLIGGARHLDLVPDGAQERLTWSSPLSLLLDQIVERRGQRVCVLATGDPLHYGIGVSLLKRIPREEVVVVPGLSAFSLAAARLGWSLAETATLTLHGRPLAGLQPQVQPGAKLLILSEDGTTPGQVADLLVDRGYGDSKLTVLEHMGGPKEARREAVAKDFAETNIADLNTLAVDCVAGPNAVLLPRTPGLPDAAFRHDGQLTKREVRAVTLAALAPLAGQTLWDVGAGCGSVAIEWLRAAPGAGALAIETSPARRALIADNALALGTPALQVIAGAAPEALEDLPAPDAVFLGGGLAAPGLFEHCWQHLAPGGRLVANAVTLEGERAMGAFRDRHGGDLTRLAVARAEALGDFTGWRPLAPVTQLAAVKP
ncbi:MAG: precorrin-6y C5,15-methyltransferase (decarboxylating) subunit CbiE [Pseudomonadota bacterium]